MISRILILIFFILFYTDAASYGVVGVTESSPPEEKRDCWSCHRSPNLNTSEGIIASQELCFECHAKEDCRREIGGHSLSLQIKPEEYVKTKHQYIASLLGVK